MDQEFNLQTAVVVHDYRVVAALAAAGFMCTLLTDESGALDGVFDDTPELKEALDQFKTHGLQVDALDYWEALIQAESAAIDQGRRHVRP